MSKTAIVYTCAHAEPDKSNERFDWLGQLIYDVKPDYVIDLGDGADMRSLNSYDSTRPAAIVSQNYGEDIDCYNDAQERIRWQFKKNRKKRPAFYGFEGNHETRIKKAISHDPRVEDRSGKGRGISFRHLNTDRWFDEYWEYENGAPAIHSYDGVDYAHFISSGNLGRAMSGDYHAANLLKKRMNSCTVGHSHKLNIAFRPDAGAIGLVAGCFKGGAEDWAGQANQEWSTGVVIKRNLDSGVYDFEWVSVDRLREAYSS